MTTLADSFFKSRELIAGLTVPMVVRGDDTLTAGDFVGHVHALALALEADGIQPGQRVAVIAGARSETMVIDWACFLLGAVSVALDPSWPAHDLGRALRNAGAHWIFHGDGIDATVATLAASLTMVPRMVALDGNPDTADTTWTRLIAGQAENRGAIPLGRFRDRVRADDPAMIVYLASPSPEGLVMSHRMVLAALAGVEERLRLVAGDPVLSTLPSVHPLHRLLTLACWRRGFSLILDTTADASPEGGLDPEPTVLCAHAEILPETSLGASIRRVVAADPLEASVRDALLGQDITVVQTTCAAGCVLTLDSIANRPNEALGRSIAGVALRVGDNDEILARGPAIPETLWQREDGGARIGPDGWLRTGLRGWVDPAAILFRHEGDPAPGGEATASSTTSS